MTKETKILSVVEEFSYGNLLLIATSLTDERFILEGGSLHLVKSITDGEVLTESGNYSTSKFVCQLFVVESKGTPYLVLSYSSINKIVILYEDITYESTYYGRPKEWVKKSLPHISDYFNHIIDKKISEGIDAINLDASQILSIVNRYSLPASRDLMLIKAIDKYSQEMNKLLGAIDNPLTRDSFTEVIASIKEIGQGKKKSVKRTNKTIEERK